MPGATPGRGGVTRGRGDAALAFSNDTQGDTSAFEAKRLPPGRVPPKDWHVVGLNRAAPTADPVRDAGAGSAGATGSGAASWRRRMAPHHREVVRKFFTNEAK